MNKLYYFLFVLTFKSQLCYSQNYVNNHSFESMYACPNGYYQIDSCIGWTSYGVTPDFFNTCGTFGFQIPDNFIGWRPAYDGDGYIDVITYSKTINEREYVGTELNKPLIVGKKYFVSCYACRANHYLYSAASNNIGFRFFNNSYSVNSPCPTDNFAHVYSSNIINDSINWTKIEGSFFADSAYRYLAIGNFFDDYNTDTADFYDPFVTYKYADYYIDYVCVSEDSLMNCDIPATSSPNINSHNLFNIRQDNYSNLVSISCDYPSCILELINIEGKTVKKLQMDYFQSLDISQFEDGVYIIKISSPYSEPFIRKILKAETK